MRLEHHLVGGYVRYISPHIIIIINVQILPQIIIFSVRKLGQKNSRVSFFYANFFIILAKLQSFMKVTPPSLFKIFYTLLLGYFLNIKKKVISCVGTRPYFLYTKYGG